jgi:hypothetical protein
VTHHLAQLNIARWTRAADAPENADFHANLDRINALAEAQPGFVWRLTGEGNNATDIAAFDDPAIITNMSLWRDFDSLAAFVYRTAHRDIMRRRAEWFDRLESHLVLWWVPAGTLPDLADAKRRLALLQADGPTPAAFTLRAPFPAPAP